MKRFLAMATTGLLGLQFKNYLWSKPYKDREDRTDSCKDSRPYGE